MNAAEQALSIESTSKIATIVHLFKAQWPALRADLKPWANDPETRQLIDPDSIDLGFHFPGISRHFHCRSLLVQIRFHQESHTQVPQIIGIDISGFDHRGQRWHLSTIHQWQYEGHNVPEEAVGEQLKTCCRQIFDIFQAASAP